MAGLPATNTRVLVGPPLLARPVLARLLRRVVLRAASSPWYSAVDSSGSSCPLCSSCARPARAPACSFRFDSEPLSLRFHPAWLRISSFPFGSGRLPASSGPYGALGQFGVPTSFATPLALMLKCPHSEPLKVPNLTHSISAAATVLWGPAQVWELCP
jgi:hypothetical protein